MTYNIISFLKSTIVIFSVLYKSLSFFYDSQIPCKMAISKCFLYRSLVIFFLMPSYWANLLLFNVFCKQCNVKLVEALLVKYLVTIAMPIATTTYYYIYIYDIILLPGDQESLKLRVAISYFIDFIDFSCNHLYIYIYLYRRRFVKSRNITIL